MELGRPRRGVSPLGLELQLQLGLQVCLLLGFLVTFLQVLHQDSDDHVDQDKLSGQDEGDEVDGGDHGVVASAGVMGAVPQSVLGEERQDDMS